MNQRSAKKMEPNDLLQRIEEIIRRRVTGSVRNLRLIISDDGLVMQGHAETYYIKQLAQHAVMELTNLPIRANEIEVSQVPKDRASK